MIELLMKFEYGEQQDDVIENRFNLFSFSQKNSTFLIYTGFKLKSMHHKFELTKLSVYYRFFIICT